MMMKTNEINDDKLRIDWNVKEIEKRAATEI